MTEYEFPADYPAAQLLQQTSLSLVITNPSLPHNPIVFVNRAFEQVTGFARNAVLGKNCKLLQGPDTDLAAVARIRDILSGPNEGVVTILNYRADGRRFWNELNISPIYAADGRLAYFIGIQREVPGPEGKSAQSVSQDLMLQEIQHRVKNHLSMVVSLIRSQARSAEDEGEEGYVKLARRVEALQLLYEQLHATSSAYETVDIGAYAGQIVAAVTHLNATKGIRVNIDAVSAEVSIDLAVQIGLILSEVLTNSLQHAFSGRDRGIVEVAVQRTGDNQLTLIVRDDGVGLPTGVDWPRSGGSGGRIVSGMIDFAAASVSVDTSNEGTQIAIGFPTPARSIA